MKPNEILEQLKEDNRRLFKGVEDKLALRIIRATLGLINEEVSSADDGRVAFTGLGTFVVKSVEREASGTSVKRITFRPVRPRSEAADE
jgi:hypothetical protein